MENGKLSILTIIFKITTKNAYLVPMIFLLRALALDIDQTKFIDNNNNKRVEKLS